MARPAATAPGDSSRPSRPRGLARAAGGGEDGSGGDAAGVVAVGEVAGVAGLQHDELPCVPGVKGYALPVASDAIRMLAPADRHSSLAPVRRNAHPAGAQYPVRCGPAPKRDVVAGSDQLGCSRPKRSMILRARSPVLSPNATVQTCCRASG